jgi:hypothetical protein
VWGGFWDVHVRRSCPLVLAGDTHHVITRTGGLQGPANTPAPSVHGSRPASRQESPQLSGAAKKRGARNKYVDVMNPNATPPAAFAIPAGMIRPPSFVGGASAGNVVRMEERGGEGPLSLLVATRGAIRD